MHPSEDIPDIRQFLEVQTEGPLTPIAEAKALPAELEAIAASIQDISGDWNAVEIVTPDAACIAREKEAFLAAFDAGNAYQPVFTYGLAQGMDMGDARAGLRSLLERLDSFRPATRLERLSNGVLRAKILDDLTTCDLVDGIKAKDDALVKGSMDRKYPPLDDSLLHQEKAQSADDPNASAFFSPAESARLKDILLDPNDQKLLFSWALGQYGLLRGDGAETGDGFHVIISPDAQSVDVRHRSAKGPAVFVGAGKPMSAARAIILLRHEIEGHARQVSNGRSLFRLGSPGLIQDDETMYEGFAMRLETETRLRYFGKRSTPQRFYAHAVRRAEEGGGFSEVFRDHYERYMHATHADPEEAKRVAWTVAYRVMRGHTDLSNKHAFAMRKDIGYARGQESDAHLVAMGKGHYNEAAVLGKGWMELVGCFDIRPGMLPYRDRNVTDVFARACAESLRGGESLDIRAFVARNAG